MCERGGVFSLRSTASKAAGDLSTCCISIRFFFCACWWLFCLLLSARAGRFFEADFRSASVECTRIQQQRLELVGAQDQSLFLAVSPSTNVHCDHFLCVHFLHGGSRFCGLQENGLAFLGIVIHNCADKRSAPVDLAILGPY
jgi:hypothetical protein